MSWSVELPTIEADPFSMLPPPPPSPAVTAAPAPAMIDFPPGSFGAPASLDYAEPYVDAAPAAAAVDPALAAQLAEADGALRGLFEIGEPVAGQDAAPNQISQEQYDALVAQYADIANGRGDLRLGTDMADPEAYRAGAMADIATILQSPTGRELIASLHQNLAPGSDEEHRITTLGFAPSVQASECLYDKAQEEQIWSGGAGLDANPIYRPGEDSVDDRSDVILFHELRHALDVTGGSVEPGFVSAGSGVFGDFLQGVQNAEHQVIGIGDYAGVTDLTENQYRQDRIDLGELDMELRDSYK